jgi:hypothetical protein
MFYWQIDWKLYVFPIEELYTLLLHELCNKTIILGVI